MSLSPSLSPSLLLCLCSASESIRAFRGWVACCRAPHSPRVTSLLIPRAFALAFVKSFTLQCPVIAFLAPISASFAGSLRGSSQPLCSPRGSSSALRGPQSLASARLTDTDRPLFSSHPQFLTHTASHQHLSRAPSQPCEGGKVGPSLSPPSPFPSGAHAGTQLCARLSVGSVLYRCCTVSRALHMPYLLSRVCTATSTFSKM